MKKIYTFLLISLLMIFFITIRVKAAQVTQLDSEYESVTKCSGNGYTTVTYNELKYCAFYIDPNSNGTYGVPSTIKCPSNYEQYEVPIFTINSKRYHGYTCKRSESSAEGIELDTTNYNYANVNSCVTSSGIEKKKVKGYDVCAAIDSVSIDITSTSCPANYERWFLSWTSNSIKYHGYGCRVSKQTQPQNGDYASVKSCNGNGYSLMRYNGFDYCAFYIDPNSNGEHKEPETIICPSNYEKYLVPDFILDNNRYHGYICKKSGTNPTPEDDKDEQKIDKYETKLDTENYNYKNVSDCTSTNGSVEKRSFAGYKVCAALSSVSVDVGSTTCPKDYERWYVKWETSKGIKYHGFGCRKSNESSQSANNVDYSSLCANEGPKKTFRLLGIFIYIAKIVGPLLIVIFGMLDYAKAIVSDDAKALDKATTSFLKRLVAGIIIFLIPSLAYLVVNFISTGVRSAKGILDENNSNYGKCTKCLFKPFTECK